MSSYSAPQCLTCQYYMGPPPAPGERAECEVKARGIPEEIYWEGKTCSSYKKDAEYIEKEIRWMSELSGLDEEAIKKMMRDQDADRSSGE